MNLYDLHADPEKLAGYDILSGRKPIKNPMMAMEFAFLTTKRLPKSEPYIMKDPEAAFKYSTAIMHERWPEAEPYIKQNQEYWERYKDIFSI